MIGKSGDGVGVDEIVDLFGAYFKLRSSNSIISNFN